MGLAPIQVPSGSHKLYSLNAKEILFRKLKAKFAFCKRSVSCSGRWVLGVLTVSRLSETGFSVGFSAVVDSLVSELGKPGRFGKLGKLGIGKLVMIPRSTLPIPPSLPPPVLLSSVSLRGT